MKTVLLACGALAREILALKAKHGWAADVVCLPALLHNQPQQISGAVRARIRELKPSYDRVLVVYADCGTGGELDAVLQEEGVRRVRGPHCYELLAGPRFQALMSDELGTFFLTDYLVRSFDHLVIEELGLDRFPQLKEDYFRHYRRVVYLVQQLDPKLLQKAAEAAAFLDLPLEIVPTGLGALETELLEWMQDENSISDRLLA